MSYRIAVVDDQPVLLNRICRMAEKLFSDARCDVTLYPFLSAQALDDYLYDAFLLDIDLPQLDGIRLAQQIRENGNTCPLIFISNIENRVFQALRVQPLRFVRKNMLEEELPEAIHALTNHLVQYGSDTLVFKDADGITCIPTQRVLYLESFRKVQQVITADHTYEAHSSMQQMEGYLTRHGFFRIHRCYLVNMSAVFQITRHEVLLKNGTRLPISRNKVDEAMTVLKEMIFHDMV